MNNLYIMPGNIPKIILVATDAKKKSLVFIDEALKIYSLQEATKLAKDGLLKDLYTVTRSGKSYLRTKPAVPKEAHLDYISVSSYVLFSSLGGIGSILSIPAFKKYWEKFQIILSEEDEPCIIIDGRPHITQKKAKAKLQENKDNIFAAAEKFDIDPFLLAGVLIDELARLNPIEDITDMLSVYFVGVNTSAGIGQVKTDTARNLMLSGYYNPDPDKFSSKEKINKATRQQIFEYIKKPKHSIFFAAARMRYFIDEWKKFVDLNKRPEIIASLYSLSKDNPKSNPQPNDRGLQIADEFYKLAQNWLK